jgi:hypothetical protein
MEKKDNNPAGTDDTPSSLCGSATSLMWQEVYTRPGLSPSGAVPLLKQRLAVHAGSRL